MKTRRFIQSSWNLPFNRSFVFIFVSGLLAFSFYYLEPWDKYLVGEPLTVNSPNSLIITQTENWKNSVFHQTIDFEGFNNNTGADHFIIPNIVHFILCNYTEISFVDFLCIQAAYRHHHPEKIFIHTNVKQGFRGKYWDLIEKDPELRACIQIFQVEIPTEIFGQKVNPNWLLWHGTDLLKLQILMKYGGIFLDHDMFVIRSLDKYRTFEMVIEYKVDGDELVGMCLIMAHKDARFLRLWLDNYRDYRPNEWYYNAGGKPVQDLVKKQPELVHRVPWKLCQTSPSGYTVNQMYNTDNFDWHECDAFHLSYTSRVRIDGTYNNTGELDEIKIQNNSKPFSRMAKEVINNLPFNLFNI